MAQTEAKVILFSCDATGCNKQSAAENGAPPSGILGSVQISEHLGGGTVEWYAHAPLHIGKAVKAVLAASTTTSGTAENFTEEG